jgi:hypothetical protein
MLYPASRKLRRTGTKPSSAFCGDGRGRQSRVVLASVADAKSRGGAKWPNRARGAFNPRDDGGKKELVTGESAEETVKTIVQGRPDDPAPPVVTTVCLLPLHTGYGCELGTRPSLRPLSSRDIFCKARAWRPRECGRMHSAATRLSDIEIAGARAAATAGETFRYSAACLISSAGGSESSRRLVVVQRAKRVREIVAIKVDHRRREQRQRLAGDQAADHCARCALLPAQIQSADWLGNCLLSGADPK